MLNRYLTYYKPATQFMVFCAILSMSWLVGGSLIEMLNVKLTGISSSEISNLKEISNTLANQLKGVNTLLLIVTLLLPAGLFSYLAYPKPSTYLGLSFEVKKSHWLLAFLLIIIAMPFTSLLEQWSQLIPAFGKSKELDDEYNKLAEAMLRGNTGFDLVINIGAMCLVPAFIEEIFFRGCLQRILLTWMKRTPFVAILLVAVIFSAFHGQLSGFIPRVFLGLLLGLTYYYSGSIWVTMLMHAFNNAVIVVMTFLYNAKISSIDMAKLPDTNLWLGITSGLCVAGILYLIYKNRTPFQIIAVEKEPEPTLQ